MGVNPTNVSVLHDNILRDSFVYGQSPYYAMFKAGKYGIPIDKVISYANQNGIPLRSKDLVNWDNGYFEYQINVLHSKPVRQISNKPQVTATGVSFDDAKLSDFAKLPQGWSGTKKRFFPCSQNNKPLQRWGWTRDYSPELYSYAEAKALSPCGYIGQNMLYQPFVVLDIDGAGHGSIDNQVIQFGNLFKNNTMCMEDPNKPGSFHLYFSTDRLIPTRHFVWAKLDLMGNAVNAAVYIKGKKSNGLPIAQLNEEVWELMMNYQQCRKEQQ